MNGFSLLRPIARQLCQEAHAKSDTAFAQIVAVGIATGRAGNIEMGPAIAFGKFGEQGGGRTGAAGGATGIFNIGDIAFYLLAILGP